ncbi:MAG: ABC transporter permease, partial [Exilibacterium sp.]
MPYPIFIKSNVWHKEGVIINFHRLWVLAQAELGYTLKTKRYRSFLGYVYVAATIVYLMSSALHAFFSAFTATISVGSPSYMIGTVGVVSLSIYGIGIIFMGFDIRARDVRENIVEVLDCRPYYNSELVLGRFLGLFLSTWIPIVLLAFFLEILGFLLPLVGSPIGGSIELLSLITYSVFMAVPSIAFCLSLVFLITISLRHRLFATIISVAALVLLIAATFKLPASYVALVDFTGAAQMKHPSELVHSVAKASAWLQRLGVLALAFGLLGLTMLLHPRLDDNRYKLQGMFAITGCVLGIFLLSFNSIQHQNLLKHQAQWREAHQARLNEPAVDIRTVKGSITLFPGDLLTANLELVVTAPPHQSLAQPLFTLNPGLKVQKVSNDDGEKLAFDHHNGLLDIKLSKPMAAGEQRRLTLIYKGRPNENFGYLDSAINTDNLSFREAQAGKVLGFERVVFDSRYIALLPGTAWFPLPGADVARDDMQRRSKDFFNLDLTVEVPANWLVAGPGKRYKLETKEKRTKFRFAPD